MESSTIAGNSAAQGGGVANQTGLIFTLHDSIVALNQASTGLDCFDTVSSGGYNIESQADCAFGATGDQQSTDPKLAAPAGTPLETMKPQAGSPALDSGDPKCPPPGTDEVGTVRPQGPRCDIGAVEVPVPAAPLPAPPTTGRQ